MKRLFSFSLAVMSGAVICFSAQAEDRADDQVFAGRKFALKVCAACHIVAKDQRLAPTLQPPAQSFVDIMRRADMSEQSLRQFLSSPHGAKGKKGAMPNPELADYQIDKVVAYILSLKTGR